MINTAFRSFFQINRQYLPIKIHYFLLYGACGNAVPLMQVIAKEFGISSMTVGVIFTIVPLCTWISKPVFGFITDKVSNISNVLLCMAIITALSFFAILFVPPIRSTNIESTDANVTCEGLNGELVISFSNEANHSFYDRETEMKEYNCELTSQHCLGNVTLSGSINVTNSLTNATETNLLFNLYGKKISIEKCECLEHNSTLFVCESEFYENNFYRKEPFSEFKLYNFWIFTFLTIISGFCAPAMWSLTDAACYETLGENSYEFGKQRLWAAIGWGISNLLAGCMNNFATVKSHHLDYSKGFYLMLVLFAIDIFILRIYQIEKKQKSNNICKDIWKIFSCPRTILFTVGVYICGIFNGLQMTYLLWYLTELGAMPFLVGLVTTVQCFAEVPFFYFSEWFLKKLGHFNSLLVIIIVYGVRMGLYSVLYNPWCVLPIEVLQGITFAFFYSAMTLYAVHYAPPGTEATMIGVFGGIYEGLGIATGSFLGGVGFDSKGGRWTFFIASMISLVCFVLLTLSSLFISRSERMKTSDKDKILSVIKTGTMAS